MNNKNINNKICGFINSGLNPGEIQVQKGRLQIHDVTLNSSQVKEVIPQVIKTLSKLRKEESKTSLSEKKWKELAARLKEAGEEIQILQDISTLSKAGLGLSDDQVQREVNNWKVEVQQKRKERGKSVEIRKVEILRKQRDVYLDHTANMKRTEFKKTSQKLQELFGEEMKEWRHALDSGGKTPLHRTITTETFYKTKAERYLSLGYSIYEKTEKKKSFSKLAFQKRNKGAIDFCVSMKKVDKSFQKSFHQAPIKINQSIILNKFEEYLKLKGSLEGKVREIDYVELRKGQCNGFAFLAAYFIRQGKSDEWFTLLEFLSKWDGSEKALKETKLPSVLTGTYPSLDDLFEQTINDVIWFQHTSTGIVVAKGQKDRRKQFELLSGPEEIQIVPLYSKPKRTLSVKELEEWLTLFSFQPDLVIDFGGSEHATAGVVQEDGMICYYDSNDDYPFRKNFSPRELTNYIKETKYKRLGLDEIKINFHLHKFQGKGVSPLSIPEEKELIKAFEDKKLPSDLTRIFHGYPAALKN